MKTVAIVCGGDTSEHDVSMRSAAGIESFLDKERYIIYKVEMVPSLFNVASVFRYDRKGVRLRLPVKLKDAAMPWR